ncbi:hypothetical protein C2G38_2179505 [Gigaspora rosea]|uniref:Uncharacterized protein n=1 Tax=Gigaspora rosea TaxID=44941 RepID=A0A397VEX9_9GLOM|nr:hypothetical protein C2G38_2179505 [Gigaspora rosea]
MIIEEVLIEEEDSEDLKSYRIQERSETIITVGVKLNVEKFMPIQFFMLDHLIFVVHYVISGLKEKVLVLWDSVLKNQKDDIILELLVVANELLIQRLIDFVQEFLIKKEDALKLILKCDNLDFEERETLHEQIKFIRFYQIDHKEFIPAYKHLLPDNLDVDILHCHLDPDARPL